MKKRVKLVIVALLGFSTACSTLRSTSKSKVVINSYETQKNSILVMYGAPRPNAKLIELNEVDSLAVHSNEVDSLAVHSNEVDSLAVHSNEVADIFADQNLNIEKE